MAIHPKLQTRTTATTSSGSLTPQQASAISAWTAEAATSLQDLTLGEATVPIADQSASASASSRTRLRGAAVSLTIPLDDDNDSKTLQSHDLRGGRPRLNFVKDDTPTPDEGQKVSVSFRRRPPIRRDSLKRREALLKGKDGSRRRQRWENDRLLNNPWAEPPAPSDWSIQPTCPRHDPMPYYLAPLWEVKYSHAHRDRTAAKQTPKGTKEDKNQISKEVRTKLKHARAARGMLQDLEEDIRRFIQRWNEKQRMMKEDGITDVASASLSLSLASDDSSDENFEDDEDEVVFVGRNGQMHDLSVYKQRLRTMRAESHKVVFESSVDDRAAGFGRWLVYSLASYYGLHTWSVTAGEPARRAAYVGIHPPSTTTTSSVLRSTSMVGSGCRAEAAIQPGEQLPQPLWMQV